MTSSSRPPLAWAQDRNQIFITVKVQDFNKEQIEFRDKELVFKGTTKNPPVNYDMVFKFFEEIIPDHEETRYNIYGRNVLIELRKKDPKIWWPRLAETTQKLHNVKIDWERWVDNEDEDLDDIIKAKQISTDSDLDSSSDSEKEDEKEEEKEETKEEDKEEKQPEATENTEENKPAENVE